MSNPESTDAFSVARKAEHSTALVHLAEARIELARARAAEARWRAAVNRGKPTHVDALISAVERYNKAESRERSFRLKPYEIALVKFATAQLDRDRLAVLCERDDESREDYAHVLAGAEEDLANHRAEVDRLRAELHAALIAEGEK